MEIPLTRGYVALVSDHDYERVSQYNWCAELIRCKDGSIKNVYAVRAISTPSGWTLQRLHRFVAGVTDPEVKVDHRDGNGLNCQDDNLRVATQAQNQANRGAQRNNTSGFKGVTWSKQAGKWQAKIEVNGKSKHLGYFRLDQIEEAAQAYDRAAIELFGEFAHLNFAPAC
jgi:hypothetical protein